MARKSAAEKLADRLSAPTPRVPPIPPESFLSTGCTVLNMAFSGHPDRGVSKGTYVYFVGDSGAMKTWGTFCLFAEAARNNQFDDYRFVHDNAENGALMDVEKFFGRAVVDRLEPPRLDAAGDPAYSETAQEFYLNLESNCRQGPCIYALDSMDALNDDDDEKKFEAELTVHEGGKAKVPGSMGMAKAKTNSKNINRVVKALRRNGSILVVISQTRDKVGSHIPGMKTRGGGKALKFYAHLEAWLSVRGAITKHHQGKDREIGSYIQADVQKNRITGWEGKVPLIAFVKGFGIDDLGTSVDYLIDEKHWVKPKPTAGEPRKPRNASADDDDDKGKKVVVATEFGITGNREQIVKHVQDAGEEWELRRIVAKVWQDIQAGAMPDRKPRYT
jgi:hypothetical protein